MAAKWVNFALNRPTESAAAMMMTQRGVWIKWHARISVSSFKLTTSVGMSTRAGDDTTEDQQRDAKLIHFLNKFGLSRPVSEDSAEQDLCDGGERKRLLMKLS